METGQPRNPFYGGHDENPDLTEFMQVASRCPDSLGRQRSEAAEVKNGVKNIYGGQFCYAVE